MFITWWAFSTSYLKKKHKKNTEPSLKQTPLAPGFFKTGKTSNHSWLSYPSTSMLGFSQVEHLGFLKLASNHPKWTPQKKRPKLFFGMINQHLSIIYPKKALILIFFWGGTWRIIPLSKWLVTMVIVSPLTFMAYKWG